MFKMPSHQVLTQGLEVSGFWIDLLFVLLKALYCLDDGEGTIQQDAIQAVVVVDWSGSSVKFCGFLVCEVTWKAGERATARCDDALGRFGETSGKGPPRSGY